MCSHMVKSKYCVSLLQRRLPCVGYQVSKKMASKVAVRSIEGEERMQICLKYGHDGKQEKTFNLLRLQNEEIGKTLARLQTSIVQKFSKGKRRKKAKENKSEAAESSSAHQTEDADEYIEIGLFREKEKLDDSVLNKDGWRHGDILQIAENWMPIILNPPTVKNVRLQECLMAGFPVFPQYELEFADLDQCVFSWFVGKPQNISDDSTAQGEPQKPEAVEMDSQRTKELLSNLKKESVDSWAEVSKERAFSPQSSHINHFLRLTLTPKNSEMSGEPQTVDSVGVIGAGPGMCPFEKRSQHTQELTPPGCVRIVSYNTLADLYADSDFSRTTLYPYCPPYALHIDYRKQLLLKELLGYNADLICLQEVDRKVFINDIKPTLATAGLESLHRTKAGEVCEGMATSFRSSKFKLLGEHNISISEELQGNPVHEQLLTGISAKESLKEKVLSKTTILQVTVLGCVEDPQRAVCVANTHLYFHPKANHVRLVQIITCIQHLEGVVAQYASQGLDVSLVFCGDFNSSPPFGVNEYMTTGQIPADHDDWASGGDDEAIDLSEGFNHSFTLESGCGYPAYTNFVGGFCGTLDYIYIDDSRLEVKSVVPSPSDDDVTQYTALPSIVFPSDHIAQICEVEFIVD